MDGKAEDEWIKKYICKQNQWKTVMVGWNWFMIIIYDIIMPFDKVLTTE